jgi:predicted phosphodiesterase
MRLGLIGDVHAEDDLLFTTLHALKNEHHVDRVLCVGDIVDGHGNVDRACSLLVEANALIVRGNHDRWIRADELRTLERAHRMTDLRTETITLLKTLPQTLTLDVPSGGKLLLCHGVGTNDMCRLGPDDYGYAISSNDDLLKLLFDTTIAVMVGGHTHRPMLRKFERGSGKQPLVVVNAGTLAREDSPGFVVLELGSSTPSSSPNGTRITTGRADFYRVMRDGDVALFSEAII